MLNTKLTDRYLLLLEFIHNSHKKLSIKEIAESLGELSASVRRDIILLYQKGYLKRWGTSKYYLSDRQYQSITEFLIEMGLLESGARASYSLSILEDSFTELYHNTPLIDLLAQYPRQGDIDV